MSLQPAPTPLLTDLRVLLFEADHEAASKAVDAVLAMGGSADWVARSGEAQMLLENRRYELLVVGTDRARCSDAVVVIRVARRHSRELPVVAVARDSASRRVLSRLSSVAVVRPGDLERRLKDRLQCVTAAP